MEEKLEELRQKYSEALREGDTDRATEIYWEAQELKEGSREQEEQDSGSELEPFLELNGVGKEIAEELLQEFGSYDGFLSDVNKRGLVDISGIGEDRAESILEQVSE